MRDRAEQGESFVDLSTAARRLGITRITANKLVLERRLPARRWGQRWMVDRADLEAFAETYRPDPGKVVNAALHPDHLRDALTVIGEHPGVTRRRRRRTGRPGPQDGPGLDAAPRP